MALFEEDIISAYEAQAQCNQTVKRHRECLTSIPVFGIFTMYPILMQSFTFADRKTVYIGVINYRICAMWLNLICCLDRWASPRYYYQPWSHAIGVKYLHTNVSKIKGHFKKSQHKGWPNFFNFIKILFGFNSEKISTQIRGFKALKHMNHTTINTVRNIWSASLEKVSSWICICHYLPFVIRYKGTVWVYTW